MIKNNLNTVSINNLSHFYGRNENKKQVLNNVKLTIEKGELVLLKGPSGCGKTTLLTLIGALRTCQSGDLLVLNNQLFGASTKIIDRDTGEIFFGRVPPYSVVVPGTVSTNKPKGFSHDLNLYCAVIVKKVDEKTRSKTSINELLRS